MTRIRRIMVQRGLSLERFGSKIDKSRGQISDYLNGRRGLTPEVLERIAAEYGVSVRWLRFNQGDMYEATSIETRAATEQPDDVAARLSSEVKARFQSRFAGRDWVGVVLDGLDIVRIGTETLARDLVDQHDARLTAIRDVAARLELQVKTAWHEARLASEHARAIRGGDVSAGRRAKLEAAEARLAAHEAAFETVPVPWSRIIDPAADRLLEAARDRHAGLLRNLATTIPEYRNRVRAMSELTTDVSRDQELAAQHPARADYSGHSLPDRSARAPRSRR